jgi:hypothetical protein
MIIVANVPLNAGDVTSIQYEDNCCNPIGRSPKLLYKKTIGNVRMLMSILSIVI